MMMASRDYYKRLEENINGTKACNSEIEAMFTDFDETMNAIISMGPGEVVLSPACRGNGGNGKTKCPYATSK